MTDTIIEFPAQASVLPVLSHWIDGRPVEVLPEQAGPVYDPATGQVIARVPRGGAERGGRRRGRCAKAAYPAWRDMPLIARSSIFFAYRALVYEHREELPPSSPATTARPSPMPSRRSCAAWRRSSSPAACRSTWRA